MIYFEDLDYKRLAVKITESKEDAAHFAYEDQSSISAMHVIEGLLIFIERMHKSPVKWELETDADDPDKRYILIRKEGNS